MLIALVTPPVLPLLRQGPRAELTSFSSPFNPFPSRCVLCCIQLNPCVRVSESPLAYGVHTKNQMKIPRTLCA